MGWTCEERDRYPNIETDKHAVLSVSFRLASGKSVDNGKATTNN